MNENTATATTATAFVLMENRYADAPGEQVAGVYFDREAADAAESRLYYGGRVVPTTAH